MKLAHNVRINVFAYSEEREEIKNSLLSLCPQLVLDDIDKKKIKISEQVMKGKRQGEEDIIIYSLTLENAKHCTEFIKKLLNNIKDENTHNKLCKRIDESCKCYIRLDKKSLVNGEYKLIFGDGCFHIKIALAAFPKKKKKAEELVGKVIEKVEN